MANMYGAFIDTPCGCESCWWLGAGERLTAQQLVAGGGAYGAAGIGIGIVAGTGIGDRRSRGA